MPREKPGQKQRGIMAPLELWAAIDALAARTGRTSAQEVIHALERHVNNPPRLDTPEHQDGVKKPRKPKGGTS